MDRPGLVSATIIAGEDAVALAVMGWLGVGVVLAYSRWISRAARRALDQHHQRRLELARATQTTRIIYQQPCDRPIVTAEGGQPVPPSVATRCNPPSGYGLVAGAGTLTATPGPCQHRNAVPVHTLDGELVRWLCLNPRCGEQLPATWAVLDTDLKFIQRYGGRSPSINGDGGPFTDPEPPPDPGGA